MNRKIAVEHESKFEQADLFVCALGYEARSVYAARALSSAAKERLAVAFDSAGQCSYDDNDVFLRSADFRILEYRSSDFRAALAEILTRLAAGAANNELRLRIDVSSMSRPMMAHLVLALAEASTEIDIVADFLYCPVLFDEPSNEATPILVSGPVLPEFAGWSDTPDLPVCAVVGLGFEYEQALGALEYLEPAASWAFLPRGSDARFYHKVESTNRDLLEHIPNSQSYAYSVHQPIDCFRVLESLTYSLTQDSRPVLLPFGPKIFALICMLVGQIYSPKVVVWRVSGADASKPIDRAANGEIVRLPVRFLHQTES